MKRILMGITMLIMTIGAGLSGQNLSGKLEIRLAADILDPNFLSLPQVFTGALDGKIGGEEQALAQYLIQAKLSYVPMATLSVELREAWVKFFAGPLDIQFGNQIVAWGVADAFTPVDVINPKNYSLPYKTEKIPLLMAKIQWDGPGFGFELLAAPIWQSDIAPSSRWRNAQAMPEGITIIQSTIADNRPELTWDSCAFGGRLKASIELAQGWDIALSYWRAKSSTPSASSTLTPTATAGQFAMRTSLDYWRYNMLGIDSAIALDGGFLLKTEGAYKTFSDTQIFNPEPGSARIEGVSGLEYNLGGLKTTIEYAFGWVKAQSGSQDVFTHSLLGFLTWDIDNRWGAKLAAVYNFDRSAMIAPQFSYTVADGLKVVLSIDFFLGEGNTTYGTWNGNSLAELSIEYSF